MEKNLILEINKLRIVVETGETSEKETRDISDSSSIRRVQSEHGLVEILNSNKTSDASSITEAQNSTESSGFQSSCEKFDSEYTDNEGVHPYARPVIEDETMKLMYETRMACKEQEIKKLQKELSSNKNKVMRLLAMVNYLNYLSKDKPENQAN